MKNKIKTIDKKIYRVSNPKDLLVILRRHDNNFETLNKALKKQFNKVGKADLLILNYLNEHITEVGKAFSDIVKDLNDNGERLDKEFDRHDKRLEKLEKKK